jgi:hypothetical protein
VVRLADIPMRWSKYLNPNEFRMDNCGVWEVGVGSDLQLLIFKASLTVRDRKFLHSLRIAED